MAPQREGLRDYESKCKLLKLVRVHRAVRARISTLMTIIPQDLSLAPMETATFESLVLLLASSDGNLFGSSDFCITFCALRLCPPNLQLYMLTAALIHGVQPFSLRI